MKRKVSSCENTPPLSALRERVKELECLYGIARLYSDPQTPPDVFLQGVADLLPAAWSHPKKAGARIVLDQACYSSGSCIPHESVCQRADLVVHGKRRGSVTVGYAPNACGHAPALLDEEQRLLNEVARQLVNALERRETTLAHDALQTQLQHADRLATVGRLASGLAHEINEPLGCILGFTQLLAKNTALSEVARKDVAKIETSALHARDIIRKLMIFARQTPPRRDAVPLNQLVEAGADLWMWRCEDENIQVRFYLAPDLPSVRGDEGQLRQVVTNLVLNAIHAMPGGGLLTITTARAGSGVELSIADTGIGMTPGVMARIFDPFFTTKDVDQGMGLGLSVVHGIVSGHEGTIHVESECGRGSVFRVHLPAEAEEGVTPP